MIARTEVTAQAKIVRAMSTLGKHRLPFGNVGSAAAMACGMVTQAFSRGALLGLEAMANPY